MKLAIDDFWDKWSKEEQDAVNELVGLAADTAFKRGANAVLKGVACGGVGMMFTYAAMDYFDYRTSVAKYKKLIQMAKDKGVVVTDSE